MACSNPIKLYEKDLKPSKYKNHSDFTLRALRRSFNENDYFTVPCRYCLNCRVDRQNEFVDRAEYEYIKYGCGAFVTFTYDDIHNDKNTFIDSHTGELVNTINKKDGKDFLNRLNKLVHADNKKTGYNPLCRKDYKYVITHEYGDKFNRNHVHCLFFGLDFAYCERMFWRAWQNQGAIEVGAIKNGGIAYVVKYIDSQSYGIDNFFKYKYHHQTPPCSSHSLNFGEGLYKSQLKYIKEHNGMYHWHGKDRPLPTYYKNKYKIISDLDQEKYEKRYKVQCENIYNLYEYRIKNYNDFKNFNIQLANTRRKNMELNLVNHGKQIYQPEYINIMKSDLVYKDNHRLNPNLDNVLCRIVDPDGSTCAKYNNKILHFPLKTRDLMILNTDYNKLKKIYGLKIADEMLGLEKVPF